MTLYKNFYIIFWILIAATAAAIPIHLIKLYTINHNYIYILFSIFFYLILILAYSILLLDENIAILYPLIKVISVLIVIFIGIFFYKSKLNLKNIIGIVLALTSIYLLSNH